jgi:outer membrane protein OmpA-like peptidoglycan-associated protein
VRGEDDYNIKLGQSRAEAIIAYFTKYFNISSSQFIIESKGEREPISKENDLNRRVDFVVTQ